MTGYDFHPQAREDLDEIWKFVEAASPMAADRVVAQVLAAIRGAVAFPHRGHRRPDLTSRPLRFLRVREYLIAYAPDEEPLWVIAVLHGRREPSALAEILKGRE